jgi:hypothetical protein
MDLKLQNVSFKSIAVVFKKNYYIYILKIQ